ncbi:MAG: DUF2845 domain-containing protein [Methylocystis sp.]|jgi:hypothetical protein
MKTRILLAIPLLAATTLPAKALRCGADLIVEGQSKFDVLLRCGAPSFVDGFSQYAIGVPNFVTPRPLDSYYLTYPFPMPREVLVEEWIYNFGPTQLMSALIFENGLLIRIGTLGYGR